MFNLFRYSVLKQFISDKNLNKYLIFGGKQVSIFSIMSSKEVKSSGSKSTKNSDKQKSSSDKQKTSEPKLLKSANDRLQYKYIVLKNGLKAFVVSDPSYVCLKDSSASSGSDASSGSGSDGSDSESGKSTTSSRSSGSRHKLPQICKRLPSDEKLSAVAIIVRTGSFCDPKDVQGLAHLVEHCITMGSEKFPQENALDNYLTSRGGYQNAHTEYEYTMFEIEVQRKHFYGALQRLAHCFIKPLLKSDSIQRETKPVDTEFNEAMNDDEVRIEQLLNNMANKGHPFSAFSWGNAKSLKTIPEKNGTDTQKCVKEFVDKYYYSDNIHVVLQSQESIETLEKWVTELFGQIPNTKKNSKSKEENFGKPYDNNPNFNKLYLVDPIHETDQLNILWCLPPVDKHYNTPPLDYLGHIVGHEGKGSLISFLRREHLALELAGGQEESGFANNRYSSFFVIQIKLTDSGKEKIDSVVDYVFEYIKLLQTVGPQEWFFNEFRDIEKNRFDWREEQSAINYVKKLALNMNSLPIEYILRGNKLYSKYDKQLIQSYLNLLTPNNACFIRMSTNLLKKDDKDIKLEKWFGTKYKVLDVPSKWIASHSKQSGKSTRFQFPEPNPFIATDFSIKKVNEVKSEAKKDVNPSKILNNNRLKLWHKFDNKFKLPKAIIKLHLISPHIYESVEYNVISDLFNEILTQILSEEVYAATLAGLHWGVSQTNSGLVVSVGGFDHKLNVLLDTVINRMINCEVGDNKFADVKKNLAKSYHNSFVEPASLNKSLRLALISNRHFTSIEKRAALESVDQKKFKAFVTKLFSNFYIEALFQGNLTKEESIDLMNKIDAKLKLSTQSGTLEEPKLMTAEIPIGDNCCRIKSLSFTNKNSSITNYYQLKPADIRLHCLVSVMSSIMEEPCFNILRTKEGLGYHVSASDYDTYGISAYGVSVSSSGNEYDCTFIDQRIENFLKLMIDFINNMKDNFKTHINSIIIAKKVPDIQLSEEFSRNWNEITSFNYCFDRLAKEIKCLEKITFEDFKEWSLNKVLKNEKKRKLSIQIVGNGTKSLSECLTFNGKELNCDKKSDDEKSDNESSEQSFKKFKLTYLKSKSKDIKTNKFIEDIPKFKKSLNVFPVHKVIE